MGRHGAALLDRHTQPEGRVVDFHALRHSYIILLERSGVSPKLAQELARHSDIRLTMNVYTHARLHDLAGAVEGLPSVLTPRPEVEEVTLKATGTDNASTTVDRPVCTGFAPTDATREDCLRLVESSMGKAGGKQASPKALIPQGVEASCDSVRLAETELPGQDSNLDKENQNLLCYRYTTG